MRRILALSLLIAGSLSAPRVARADRLSLEGGLNAGGNFPYGTETNDPFVTVGFTGQVSYEMPHWGFGARVHGTYSNPIAVDIAADGYELRGRLSRRQYRLELISRYFLSSTPDNRGGYLELGIIGHETDFVNAEQVIVLPESQDYTRLFLRGSGFTIGYGHRPRTGPFFWQLNFELDRYELLEVTGLVNYLHPILVQAPLKSNSFNSAVMFLIGLDVFGR